MKYLITLYLLLVSSSVLAADAKVPDISKPRPEELLSEPIQLDCGPYINIRIVEWRASRRVPLTGVTPEGIAVMNRACQEAVENYPAYLKSKHLNFVQMPVNVNISLLPSNSYLDGTESRNLDDLKGRFKYEFNECCFWGLYIKRTSSLFFRNDPILTNGIPHKYFIRAFQHELAHIFDDQWNVMNLNDISYRSDEKMAEDWVRFIGFKFETETMEDDLETKRRYKMINK